VRLRSIKGVSLHGRALTPTHKNILLEFADGVNDDGVGFRSTIAQVAKYTELSKDQVKRIRKDLIEVGLIVVLKASKGPGHATLFKIVPEVMPLLDPEKGEGGLSDLPGICDAPNGDGVQSAPLSKKASESGQQQGSQEPETQQGAICTPLSESYPQNVDKLSTEIGKGCKSGQRGAPMHPERGAPTPPHPSSIKSSSRADAPASDPDGLAGRPREKRKPTQHLPLYRRAIEVGLEPQRPAETESEFRQRIEQAELERET
jgi:hypothetical protein